MTIATVKVYIHFLSYNILYVYDAQCIIAILITQILYVYSIACFSSLHILLKSPVNRGSIVAQFGAFLISSHYVSSSFGLRSHL